MLLQIDLVFEERDDGFLYSVNQLMLTSKRPIIATTSSDTRDVSSLLRHTHRIYNMARPTSQALGAFFVSFAFDTV